MRRAALILLFLASCGKEKPATTVGTLERERIEVVAEFSEPISAVRVAEGALVRTGDVILEQDTALLGTELDAAGARIAESRARLDEIRRGTRSEQIRAVRARLEEAEARVVNAKRELDRSEKLVGEGASPRAELDARRRDFDVAAASRDAARAMLDETKNGSTAEMIRAAEANLANAQASLDQLRTRGARLVVRAPVSGLIDVLPFKVGERPPAGGVVAVILEDSAPYARVYVSEQIRVKVLPGTKARITVDGSEKTFPGVVRTISHEASFTPYFALTEHDRGRLSYLAEIALNPGEARELPTGMPCEAEFLTEE